MYLHIHTITCMSVQCCDKCQQALGHTRPNMVACSATHTTKENPIMWVCCGNTPHSDVKLARRSQHTSCQGSTPQQRCRITTSIMPREYSPAVLSSSHDHHDKHYATEPSPSMARRMMIAGLASSWVADVAIISWRCLPMAYRDDSNSSVV